ncbi:hypothetical protein EOA36_31440, partial [Mesorhizobium sp. M8A.F.Ca.ET.021.01.1.1]
LFAMSTFEDVPFRQYRAVLSPELVPPAPALTAVNTTRDGAKNMALQAHYILLKRDRLLEALKQCPEQMMSWSRHERLTEAQDGIGISAEEGS